MGGAMSQIRKSDGSGWTFMTNHAHVLILLAQNPDRVLREVAASVGITERAVQRIVAELEEDGYIHRSKEGRKNTYAIDLSKPLRHPIESHCSIGDLVDLIRTKEIPPARTSHEQEMHS